MTLVLAVALVLVVLAAFVLVDRGAVRQRDERRELLTRIQHPQLVPPVPARRVSAAEPEPDELHLVGTIATPPDAGS